MNEMELALLKKRSAQSNYDLDLLTRKLKDSFVTITARKIYFTISLKLTVLCCLEKYPKYKSFIYQT